MPADSDGQQAVQALFTALLEPAQDKDLLTARQDDVGDDLPVRRVLLHLRAGAELVMLVHDVQYFGVAAADEAVFSRYYAGKQTGFYN